MLTGVELGPSTCVLVRTRREGSVASARIVDARDRSALASALAHAARDGGFSRRARVVAWGAPGSQVALDLDHLPDVDPIVEAGFEIESIVSPAQALAMTLESARVDTGRAVAAIALNRQAAALAIVHRGQVVAARTFEWPLGEPFSGGRSELLERYLVISQLAPHLKHLIDLAAPVYNTTVSSVVLCGNLPGLRSLSMLLVEEMDLEVETLDSAEMLAPGVAPQVESAAALQLAAAAASHGVPSSKARVKALPPPVRGGWAIRSLAGAAAFAVCATWATLQVAGSSPAAAAFPDGLGPAARAEAPAPTAPRPEATIGRTNPEPEPPPPVAAPSPLPGTARRRAGATGAVARPLEVEPLTASDPLPRVDGVAIAGDRRLAIVDGAIVGPGDRVGRRVILRIESGGVVLRDPGGREVFVGIRSRKPSPGGP